ncbi:glutathione S-transferase family protein [Halomonas sp. DP5N14-9]|uniref:glutathione S-transferase family protein n=1 Tax=Halomonas sp. DP5N14-9 TaxID=2859075 RepID=UPI001C99D688|nr:glutathione S-transferase family protein [Halomonas sp. DP5N14-9]MBY5942982.1 glutathione S-transferase family protein [Halomonas sp. DP5N14-9]
MASVHIVGPAFSNFVRSVVLVCHEKGIEHSVGMEVEGRRVELHSPEFKALNPFDKIPVLIHGERRLYESVAICRYLEGAFDGPDLLPRDDWTRAQVDQWCAALATQADQAIVRRYLLELVFPKGPNGEVREDRVREAAPEVARILTILEHQLAGRDFLVGDGFTLADALAAPMLDYLEATPPAASLMEAAPNTRAYVERLRSRPSGKAVLVAPVFPR